MQTLLKDSNSGYLNIIKYTSKQRKLTETYVMTKKINQQEGIAILSVYAQNNRPAKIHEAKKLRIERRNRHIHHYSWRFQYFSLNYSSDK